MRVRQWLEEPGLTLIRGWARAGVSPRTIAGRMGVGLRTLERWRRKYPELDGALSGTKEVVDSQVEDALLQKALGYESIEPEGGGERQGGAEGGQHGEASGAGCVRHLPVAEKTQAGAVGGRRERPGAAREQPADLTELGEGGAGWNIRASARGRS